ncbi:MAG: hypothetical protein ABIQ74_13025 [Chitinophagales bacterium]
MADKLPDLDNFFRENISDYELYSKKGNWEMLNNLLDDQNRKKKRTYILFFLISFLLLFTGGLVIVFPSGEKKQSANAIKETSVDIIQSPSETPAEHAIVDSSAGAFQPDNNEKNHAAENKFQKLSNDHDFYPEKKRNHNPGLIQHPVRANPAIAANGKSPAEIHPEIDNHQYRQKVVDSIGPVMTELKISEPVSAIHFEAKKISSEITMDTAYDISKNSRAYDSITTKPDSSAAMKIPENNKSASDTSLLKPVITLKTRFLNLNFYAGLNSYSTSSGSLKKEQNIAPLIGLELMLSFNSKFAVGLGAIYSPQGGYHLTDSAREVSYFLNKNISEQTIQIHRLHQVYFPLTLYYSIAARHSASGGVQLSYLVNTIGDFTELNIVSESTTQMQKNNVSGYMDGINSTNVSVSLGYKFSPAKRLDLCARATRELSPSYDSEYFNGVAANPAWSFQTFLIARF